MFKHPNILEADCEDYGQGVIYKCTIENHSNKWSLDHHHTMLKGIIFPICGNTWNMLYETRFREHFEFIDNFNKHYGIFPGCGKYTPFTKDNDNIKSC